MKLRFFMYICIVMDKKKDTDYLKAARRGSRQAELELYGRPVPRTHVHKSRKIYNRKRVKAGLKDLL